MSQPVFVGHPQPTPLSCTTRHRCFGYQYPVKRQSRSLQALRHRGTPAGSRGRRRRQLAAAGPQPGSSGVAVEVEPAPNNARRLYAGVDVGAPVAVVWRALTDYDSLGSFIPGLAENRCLARRPNGAQLVQVGEQEIALGAKFRARIVLDVEARHHDFLLRPCMEFWGGLPSSRGNGANGTSTSGRGGGEHIEPRSPLQAPPHDLTFNSVEGDFQVFKGVWRMQDADRGGKTCRLSYCLFVRPQIWLPVRLVQGRVEMEIKSNLAAVRQHAEEVHRQALARR